MYALQPRQQRSSRFDRRNTPLLVLLVCSLGLHGLGGRHAGVGSQGRHSCGVDDCVTSERCWEGVNEEVEGRLGGLLDCQARLQDGCVDD